eukprot:1358311-Pyramimonas_sp.AAC.1
MGSWTGVVELPPSLIDALQALPPVRPDANVRQRKQYHITKDQGRRARALEEVHDVSGEEETAAEIRARHER